MNTTQHTLEYLTVIGQTPIFFLYNDRKPYISYISSHTIKNWKSNCIAAILLKTALQHCFVCLF